MLKWVVDDVKGYRSTNEHYYVTKNELTGHSVVYFVLSSDAGGVIFDKLLKGSKYARIAYCKRIADKHWVGISYLAALAETEHWEKEKLAMEFANYLGVEINAIHK